MSTVQIAAQQQLQNQEEKDVLEHFASVFTVLDTRRFGLLVFGLWSFVFLSFCGQDRSSATATAATTTATTAATTTTTTTSNYYN